MPTEDEDQPLDVYWDVLRGLRGRRQSTDPVYTVPQFRDLAGRGDLVIGTSAERVLVIIKPDGQLLFGPEYTPQEASMIFWEYMGIRRYQLEDRMLLIQHMEAVLVRLGRADMEMERLRLLAAGEEDPLKKAEYTQQADIAGARLNMVAHEAIELGRGLVRRPEVVPPVVPDKVPEQIRQNPDSDYQGKDGLPPESDPST